VDSQTAGQVSPESPGSSIPIFQVHPSGLCNLACRHCYSNSGPSVRDELEPELVCSAIRDAAAAGYRVVSVSGGEPFMYRGLLDLLKSAKSAGMRTTVTTNGFFLQPQRLAAIRDYADLIAVSFDGRPQLHNRIRASRKAFECLIAGVSNLRANGFNFGLIHTLTHESWEDLLWIAEFAAESGAILLQIHPLERAGRAEKAMPGKSFTTDDTNARAYLLSAALAAKYAGRMTVQLDLLHRSEVLRNPGLIYGSPASMTTRSNPAALMRTLVLETDGTVVPVAYGFSHHYGVCNITEASIGATLSRYMADGFTAFVSLCRDTFDQIANDERVNLFNWHELIVARSHRSTK
jgi:MoaA/NifB/PqqE/SkfB family radical SAM enzyme